MHIYALGKQHRTLAGEEERRSRLEEEEGLFRFQAVEFGDVVSTIVKREELANGSSRWEEGEGRQAYA